MQRTYGPGYDESQQKTVVASGSLLVSSTTTAGQVILTYTVPTFSNIFFLETFQVQALPTVATTTFFDMGTWSLQLPSGSDSFVGREINNTIGTDIPFILPFPEPLPFAQGTVLRVIANPAVTTAIQWRASIGGYVQKAGS